MSAALHDEVRNETLAVLRYFGVARRVIYRMWFITCGTRRYPGALCWLVAVLSRQPPAWARLRAVLGGRFEALRDWQAARNPKARGERGSRAL